MKEIFCYLIIMLCFFTGLANAENSRRQILVVSAQWHNKTNKDGTGYFFDLLHEVYDTQGIEIKIKLIPFSSATTAFRNGSADLLLGAYPNKYNNTMLYANRPVTVDKIDMLLTKQFHQQCKDIRCLKDKRVVSASGYDITGFVDFEMEYSELRNVDSMVKMLLSGRVDAVVDYKDNLLLSLAKIGDNNLLIKESILVSTEYFLFYNSDKGRLLKKMFDNKMEELIASGKLKTMHIKSFGDLRYYPFKFYPPE